MTPWTVAHQAPLSVELPRQEYWSGFAIPFSRGSSQTSNGTHVSCTGRRILPLSCRYLFLEQKLWEARLHSHRAVRATPGHLGWLG